MGRILIGKKDLSNYLLRQVASLYRSSSLHVTSCFRMIVDVKDDALQHK